MHIDTATGALQSDAPESEEPEDLPVVGEHARVAEGLVAGFVGAATIAVFFFIIDLFAGRPLYTPSLLGTALVKGPAAAAGPDAVHVSFQMVVLFTWVHLLVFSAIGAVASFFLRKAERYPDASYGVVLLGAMLVYGFQAVCYLWAHEVIGLLGAWQIFVANLLAAGTMGLYLWRGHRGFSIKM